MAKEDTKKTTKKFEIKRNFGRGDYLPLRRNMDYTSIARKTIMAGVTGFFCLKCGFTNDDSDYEHSEDECLLAGVHLP